MVKDEVRSKRSIRDYIIKCKTNNPKMKASDIADKAGTTLSYVYNVLSDNKPSPHSKRGRSRRSNGAVSGGSVSFYEEKVLDKWIEALDAPVINSKTGMKQIGLKKNGDLCSCQLHRNGTIIVHPHALGWEDWLTKKLVFVSGLKQYIFQDFSAGKKMRETKIPIKYDKTNQAYLDDKDIRNFIVVELGVNESNISSMETYY